jgi:hypothetical protein
VLPLHQTALYDEIWGKSLGNMCNYIENVYLSVYFKQYLIASCSSAGRLAINIAPTFVFHIEAACTAHVNLIDFNIPIAIDYVYNSQYCSLFNIVTCISDSRGDLDW